MYTRSEKIKSGREFDSNSTQDRKFLYSVRANEMTVRDLVIEYFLMRPNENMSHNPVVDYVESKYKKNYIIENHEIHGEKLGVRVRKDS